METTGSQELMFSSAAVLDLLLQIDELKDYTVGLTETLDGGLQLQVGESTYLIQNEATTVEVDDQVVDQIENTTEDAYEDIVQDVGDEYTETIEGGIIKEAAKSLLLGGMIRFASKHLLK
jgi:hypothetical protein